MSLKSAKKKAWDACSKYIRLKYSRNGYCVCVTCNTRKPIKEIQAGHFVDSRRNAVLFDERNIRPQCYACNILKSGNIIEYYPFMLKTYGQEVIDELKANKHKVIKWSELDYLDLEKEFLRKIEVLHNG